MSKFALKAFNGAVIGRHDTDDIISDFIVQTAVLIADGDMEKIQDHVEFPWEGQLENIFRTATEYRVPAKS